MVDKGVNIYVGASSIRTCLGNKSETLSAMQKGESGLGYSNEASMYIGYSDVKEHAKFTRFESQLIEQ